MSQNLPSAAVVIGALYVESLLKNVVFELNQQKNKEHIIPTLKFCYQRENVTLKMNRRRFAYFFFRMTILRASRNAFDKTV